MAGVAQHRREHRSDVAVMARDENPHGTRSNSRSSPASSRPSAASRRLANGDARALGDVEKRGSSVRLVQHPELRQLLVRRACPTHASIEARACRAAAPLLARDSRYRSVSLEHVDDLRAPRAANRRERPSVISSRSSPDEWYSGNSLSSDRVRQPTGRSKPGELNCRSSHPHGTKSRMRPPSVANDVRARPDRRTCLLGGSACRSTGRRRRRRQARARRRYAARRPPHCARAT